MSLSLATAYPWYFTVFCMLLAAGVAWLTYHKTNIATRDKRKWGWPVWLLAVLRFISVFIVAYLLLGPVLKSIFKKVEKPIVVVAMDNSQSILLNKDSSIYLHKLPNEVNELSRKLGEDFEVHTISFGAVSTDKLVFDYAEKQTNISDVFDRVYNGFYNRNIGAVVMLTDGLYNEGENPAYAAQRINAPFYMVAMGDTSPQKDVAIRDVDYNEIVYSGNIFPVNIHLSSKGFSGRNVQLSISNRGTAVSTQQVHITGDKFMAEIPVKIEAKAPGIQHYHITVTELDGEISHVNNHSDIFVNVIDSKKKILLVAAAPHPDIAALKNAIERNSFYEVTSFTFDEFSRQAYTRTDWYKNFQLVILHGIPSAGQAASSLISGLKADGVPVMYFLSSSTALNTFNTFETGLEIRSSAGRTNEVTPIVNNDFPLFQISDETKNKIAQWPAVIAPFGEYSLADRQNVLIWQQLGRVKSEMPLLFFTKNARQKIAVFCGEGLWKWFVFDYAQNENRQATDEVINKTIQYLSVKIDNSQFRVKPTKNIFAENERITFEAEAYDPSFEPAKNALVKITLKGENGKSFDYSFQPKGNGYFLDAGFLASGTYTWRASTAIGGKPFTASGEFIVKKIDIEFTETVANHHLLYNIARQQGGQMLYPADISKIPDLIKAREDVKPVAYMKTDYLDLIHYKWVFFLLLALLSAEWFIRKYHGSY